MADEYYERYKHLSHQELYRMLQAGSSHQVDTVADNWASIGDTVSAISATLQHDLKRLLPDWTSQGSREFHYRLELIVRYAQTLADEASAMRTGLTVMASSLRETQRRAESPATVPDSAFRVGDLIDGVVGATLGRVLPAVERAQAHERIVRLVAKLAADYGISDHGNWPVMVPEAPIDLPATGIASGLAGGAVLGSAKPKQRDHGHRDHGHGHRSSSGAPSATSTGHGHLGSLGPAVIGGASGWSQYSRPAHLAGHTIGVDISAGGHSAPTASGGSGGSGGSSGSSGSGSGGSGSGSGSSGSGGSGTGSTGGSGGASTSGGAVGTGGAGTAMPMAPMGGGVAPSAAAGGGVAPGPALAGGGVGSAERAWHAPDPVDWADPDDDAAPSVLGD